MQIKTMEKRIDKIKMELSRIGDMRSGSLNEQRTVCGRENCRCVDPQNPRKHGPYYQLSYAHQGKSTSQFIQKEFVGTVKLQLRNYKTFRALSAEWVDLALTIAKEKLESDKKQRAIRGTKTRERSP
jgi:hypothetical protein